eukprot:scaffold9559_cov101-Isochrysis_galbana.AAC.2
MSARTPGVDRFGTARRVGHGRRPMAMALGLMSCAVVCGIAACAHLRLFPPASASLPHMCRLRMCMCAAPQCGTDPPPPFRTATFPGPGCRGDGRCRCSDDDGAVRLQAAAAIAGR